MKDAENLFLYTLYMQNIYELLEKIFFMNLIKFRITIFRGSIFDELKHG